MSDLSLYLGAPRERVLLPAGTTPKPLTSSRGLALWRGAHQLEVLDLTSQPLTSLVGLGAAVLPRARLLALGGTRLPPRALAATPPFSPGLLGLLLPGTGLVAAEPPAPLNALAWLDLSYNALEELPPIAAVYPSLRVLLLDGIAMSGIPSTAWPIAPPSRSLASLFSPTLQVLSVRGCGLTDTALALLRPAVLPSLREVDASGNAIASLPVVWRCLPHITRLSLTDNALAGGAGGPAAQNVPPPAVEELWLSDNGGLTDLSALAGCTRLSILRADGCRLRAPPAFPDGLAALSEVNISRNPLGSADTEDADAAAWARLAAAVPRLRSLNLRGCVIERLSAGLCDALGSLPQLSVLDLSGNPATDGFYAEPGDEPEVKQPNSETRAVVGSKSDDLGGLPLFVRPSVSELADWLISGEFISRRPAKPPPPSLPSGSAAAGNRDAHRALLILTCGPALVSLDGYCVDPAEVRAAYALIGAEPPLGRIPEEDVVGLAVRESSAVPPLPPTFLLSSTPPRLAGPLPAAALIPATAAVPGLAAGLRALEVSSIPAASIPPANATKASASMSEPDAVQTVGNVSADHSIAPIAILHEPANVRGSLVRRLGAPFAGAVASVDAEATTAAPVWALSPPARRRARTVDGAVRRGVDGSASSSPVPPPADARVARRASLRGFAEAARRDFAGGTWAGGSAPSMELQDPLASPPRPPRMSLADLRAKSRGRSRGAGSELPIEVFAPPQHRRDTAIADTADAGFLGLEPTPLATAAPVAAAIEIVGAGSGAAFSAGDGRGSTPQAPTAAPAVVQSHRTDNLHVVAPAPSQKPVAAALQPSSAAQSPTRVLTTELAFAASALGVIASPLQPPAHASSSPAHEEVTRVSGVVGKGAPVSALAAARRRALATAALISFEAAEEVAAASAGEMAAAHLVSGVERTRTGEHATTAVASSPLNTEHRAASPAAAERATQLPALPATRPFVETPQPAALPSATIDVADNNAKVFERTLVNSAIRQAAAVTTASPDRKPVANRRAWRLDLSTAGEVFANVDAIGTAAAVMRSLSAAKAPPPQTLGFEARPLSPVSLPPRVSSEPPSPISAAPLAPPARRHFLPAPPPAEMEKLPMRNNARVLGTASAPATPSAARGRAQEALREAEAAVSRARATAAEARHEQAGARGASSARVGYANAAAVRALARTQLHEIAGSASPATAASPPPARRAVNDRTIPRTPHAQRTPARAKTHEQPLPQRRPQSQSRLKAPPRTPSGRLMGLWGSYAAAAARTPAADGRPPAVHAALLEPDSAWMKAALDDDFSLLPSADMSAAEALTSTTAQSLVPSAAASASRAVPAGLPSRASASALQEVIQRGREISTPALADITDVSPSSGAASAHAVTETASDEVVAASITQVAAAAQGSSHGSGPSAAVVVSASGQARARAAPTAVSFSASDVGTSRAVWLRNSFRPSGSLVLVGGGNVGRSTRLDVAAFVPMHPGRPSFVTRDTIRQVAEPHAGGGVQGLPPAPRTTPPLTGQDVTPDVQQFGTYHGLTAVQAASMTPRGASNAHLLSFVANRGQTNLYPQESSPAGTELASPPLSETVRFDARASSPAATELASPPLSEPARSPLVDAPGVRDNASFAPAVNAAAESRTDSAPSGAIEDVAVAVADIRAILRLSLREQNFFTHDGTAHAVLAAGAAASIKARDVATMRPRAPTVRPLISAYAVNCAPVLHQTHASLASEVVAVAASSAPANANFVAQISKPAAPPGIERILASPHHPDSHIDERLSARRRIIRAAASQKMPSAVPTFASSLHVVDSSPYVATSASFRPPIPQQPVLLPVPQVEQHQVPVQIPRLLPPEQPTPAFFALRQMATFDNALQWIDDAVLFDGGYVDRTNVHPTSASPPSSSQSPLAAAASAVVSESATVGALALGPQLQSSSSSSPDSKLLLPPQQSTPLLTQSMAQPPTSSSAPLQHSQFPLPSSLSLASGSVVPSSHHRTKNEPSALFDSSVAVPQEASPARPPLHPRGAAPTSSLTLLTASVTPSSGHDLPTRASPGAGTEASPSSSHTPTPTAVSWVERLSTPRRSVSHVCSAPGSGRSSCIACAAIAAGAAVVSSPAGVPAVRSGQSTSVRRRRSSEAALEALSPRIAASSLAGIFGSPSRAQDAQAAHSLSHGEDSSSGPSGVIDTAVAEPQNHGDGVAEFVTHGRAAAAPPRSRSRRESNGSVKELATDVAKEADHVRSRPVSEHKNATYLAVQSPTSARARVDRVLLDIDAYAAHLDSLQKSST